MGGKFKYQEGQRIGPYNILFVKRLRKNDGKYRDWIGLFKCPYCEEGYFETGISNVVKGVTKSCGCFHRKQAAINGKKRFKDITGQHFGFLTAVKPMPKDNPNEAYTWECICNSPYHTEPQICYAKVDLLLKGHIKSCGCLTGKNLYKTHSMGEDKISDALNILKIRYIQEYIFKDCINPDTNQPLRFDFYLPDYNCCIEYDGEQHFSYSEKSSKSFFDKKNFQKIVYRDSIKNDYCRSHNIRLIRIPYTQKDKISPDYILSLLSDDWSNNEI